MKPEMISIIVYLIAGIFVGYASFLIKGNWSALLLAIVFLIAIPSGLKKAFGIKEQFKWFLSNGGLIYLFVWFITWMIFYNLVI